MKDPNASDIPDDFVALWKEAVNNNSKAWNCSGTVFYTSQFLWGVVTITAPYTKGKPCMR